MNDYLVIALKVRRNPMNTEPKNSPLFFPPGGHVQTILRSYISVNPEYLPEKKRIELADGDFMDAELSPSTRTSSESVVILLHGLEGSSSRPYMRAMANHLVKEEFRTLALNYRGCSGELNRSKITYHAGKYDDLEQVIQWVQEHLNPASIHLVGFSLGASIALNFLIHSAFGQVITSAVAISPPFQLGAISDNLQHGIRLLYQSYFLRSLRDKNRLKINQYPDYPLFSGQTLREFDDQVTAPVHGFDSAEHYYEVCSAGSRLDQIRVPVRMIHAVNDPICPLPSSFISSTSNPRIDWSIQRGGGHVAFMTLPMGWLGNQVTSFFAISKESRVGE